MNIVHISPYYPPHVGGVERHVFSLVCQEIKAGDTVTVVTRHYDSDLLMLEQSDRLSVHRIKFNDRSKLAQRIQIWTWMLGHIALFFKADVIHVHDVFFWIWPIRILFFWKPIYITFHGFEAGLLPTSKAIIARKRAEKYTQGNICIGAYIERWYGTKPSVIMYGAGDCFAKNAKRFSNRRISRLLFVGRLQEDTGIVQYLEVVKEFPTLTMDIYGDGPLREKVQSLCETNDNLHYKGTVSSLCPLFPQYDMVCASSYLSMIEVMQSGLCVISYVTDALKKDYIDCFPARDALFVVHSKSELHDVLTHLDKKLIEDKALQGWNWAKEQTWKNIDKQYRKLWAGQ